MHFTTSLTLAALTTLAAARPSQRLLQRQSTTCILPAVSPVHLFGDISAAVKQWSSDVKTVNDFLNNLPISDPSILASEAQTALLSAQDEPCQLTTLASEFDDGPAAFKCAVNDLKTVFDTHVLANLNTIVVKPSDGTAVQAAVDDINKFRCCNVLPDVDIIWKDSVEFGQFNDPSLSTSAPRPTTCGSVDCSGVTSGGAQCKGLDNGNF